jgi:hypothetical protein
MKTKHIKVYEYQELTQDAQKIAYNNWRSGVEHDFLEESMLEKLSTLLKKNKIKEEDNTQVGYSLSYCQGDGAMFYGNFTYKKYFITVKHSGRYYHYNSKEIYSISREDRELTDDEHDKIYHDFEVVYVKICKELEKYGYECIEAEESLESFKACCEDYNYTFRENGKMENF